MPHRLAVALLIGLSGACTATVDVEDYTFDIDPCGYELTECEGGARHTYLVAVTDIVRPPMGSRALDGFDFDGTDERFCANADFTSPDGVRGIDNELTDLGLLLESAAMLDLRQVSIDSILAGDSIQVIEVEAVDGLGDDDCVEVSVRQAELPTGQTPELLDQNPMDGMVDAGLTLAPGLVTSADRSACIIDGVLHARFEGTSVIPFGTTELDGERLRLRMPISEEGLGPGVFGGSVQVAGLVQSFLDGGVDITTLLEAAADLDPDPSGTQCESISWALSMQAVPVDLAPLGP